MNSFSSIMEMLMVLLFGISWPLNIFKALKSKSSKGTSILFYLCIWLGYVFALAGKFALIADNPAPWYETVHWYVLFFYFLNIAMVTFGIIIYFRNRMYDNRKNQTEMRASYEGV
ncbi:MAG: hypothetical protein MJ131_08915 [Lachnospiraceae bacterium]|nr:hypothetical protein [Lachnospiraceae bacterium]